MAAPMIPPASAAEFLAASGWARGADRAARRRRQLPPLFPRVHGDGRRAVLMDAPPPHEDPRPFIAVAEWLGSVGLTAPEILARDLDRGLLLLGDFGDDRLRETLDESPAARARALRARHRRAGPPPPPSADGRPAGPRPRPMARRSCCCSPTGIARRSASRSTSTAYRAAWRAVLEPVADDGLGPVTVLRDYHAENIMLVAAAQGVAHFGLLDFQDALAGHPAYDLASVLEDARRDVPPAIERAMIDRYIAATGHGDGVRARLLGARGAAQHPHPRRLHAAVEARRQAGITARFQPRMWGLLERDLAHPALAPVRDWFDANVPAIGARRAVEGDAHEPRSPARSRSGPQIDAAVPRDRDGHGRRPRQAHAPADRDPAQAAGRARRQAADRPCPRPAARGRGRARSWSTSIISPTRSRRISPPAPTDLDVTISDERDVLLETGGGLVQAAPLIDCDPFLVVNSDNFWIDGPADALKLLASQLGRRARWTRCCCSSRTRAPATIAGRAISTWTASAAFAAAAAARVAPFVFTGIQIDRQAPARATRPTGRSRPTSCGTARSPRGAASARSTRACGSTSARRPRSRRPRRRWSDG